MSWTPERVEMLKTLWAEGLSASQIAARLGVVTRNAVIGKIHRLGIAAREHGNKGGRRARIGPRPPGETRAAPAQTREEAIAPPEPSPDNVTVLELSDHRCRWPLGDPKGEDFRFCGNKTPGPGQTYCDYHTRRAYQGALPVSSARSGKESKQRSSGA